MADPPHPSKKEKEIWSAEHLRKFAASVSEDRLAPLLVLAMTTGMRRGQPVGLRWVDLDLEANKLSVLVTRVVVDYEVIEETPKSKSSTRVIGLDPATVQVLKAHRRHQLEERMAWGSSWTDSGLVFTQEDGVGYHPERVRLGSSNQRRAVPGSRSSPCMGFDIPTPPWGSKWACR